MQTQRKGASLPGTTNFHVARLDFCSEIAIITQDCLFSSPSVKSRAFHVDKSLPACMHVMDGKSFLRIVN